MKGAKKRYVIAIDTGGTFTDCIGICETGVRISRKVLSKGALRGEMVATVSDDSILIRQRWSVSKNIFTGYTFQSLDGDGEEYRVARFDPSTSILTLDRPFRTAPVGRFEIFAGEDAALLGIRLVTETPLDEPIPSVSVRLGTTRGTNALLERRGASPLFIATRGFGDVLAIGTQARPDIFALEVKKPKPLTTSVIEANERVSAEGEIIEDLDVDGLARAVHRYSSMNVDTAAVALVNAYRNPEHELRIGALLERAGFRHVSLSHRLSKRMSYLSRCRTTVVNAYLSPVIDPYLCDIDKAVGAGALFVMNSAGGLLPRVSFTPKDSLLSGPAGGSIGMATVGESFGFSRLIGFDMGGTSTDVSRFDHGFDYKYALSVGDGEIFTRALDIETVAAGGGSICYFDGYKLRVGPKSAGADPGPACYGAGGPLSVTDVDLLAGKLDPGLFGIPIDPAAAERALEGIIGAVAAAGNPRPARASVIAGFLAVADEIMAGAVKTISAAKGFDAADYAMVAFGGAGGLHACAVSELLGIETILLPREGGLLSAAGLHAARLERSVEKQVLLDLDAFECKKRDILAALTSEAAAALEKVAGEGCPTILRAEVFCRFSGQDSSLPIADLQNIGVAFREAYTSLFGHWHDDGQIEVETVRLTAGAAPSETAVYPIPGGESQARPARHTSGGRAVFERDGLAEGEFFEGPALLLDSFSAGFIDKGWRGVVCRDGMVVLRRMVETEGDPVSDSSGTVAPQAKIAPQTKIPPQARLTLFANRFMFIADTMGATLRRTAASVNVKERLDFSSAILDREGRLVANAHHIPVHLGALGVATRRVIETHPLSPGDIVVTNHPGFGGSHLPDVTVISPVYVDGTLMAHIASRAHHAELGGKTPGSMPPDARTLVEEGVVIPPFFLCKGGEWRFEALTDVLASGPFPSRTPKENIADIRAQVAANLKGARDLELLALDVGRETVERYFDLLRENAASEVSAMMNGFEGEIAATETLDDSTLLSVKVYKDATGKWVVDWQGSGPVHSGNLNGTEAVAASVVMYVLRVLLDQNIPLNDGILDAIRLRLSESIVSPDFGVNDDRSPAVSAGNTELSQRMTDTLLKAFGKVAASQGTMNNLLFGNATFGYYETIGGGTGAGPTFNGASGVHSHMTNTRITDVEVLEYRYPVRVGRFAIRRGSGGDGAFRGGDGLIREIVMLAPVTLSFIAERRHSGPYGMNGGGHGLPGRQWLIRVGKEREPLDGRTTRALLAGDRIVIETPGGGGYGAR